MRLPTATVEASAAPGRAAARWSRRLLPAAFLLLAAGALWALLPATDAQQQEGNTPVPYNGLLDRPPQAGVHPGRDLTVSTFPDTVPQARYQNGQGVLSGDADDPVDLCLQQLYAVSTGNALGPYYLSARIAVDAGASNSNLNTALVPQSFPCSFDPDGQRNVALDGPAPGAGFYAGLQADLGRATGHDLRVVPGSVQWFAVECSLAGTRFASSSAVVGHARAITLCGPTSGNGYTVRDVSSAVTRVTGASASTGTQSPSIQQLIAPNVVASRWVMSCVRMDAIDVTPTGTFYHRGVTAHDWFLLLDPAEPTWAASLQAGLNRANWNSNEGANGCPVTLPAPTPPVGVPCSASNLAATGVTLASLTLQSPDPAADPARTYVGQLNLAFAKGPGRILVSESVSAPTSVGMVHAVSPELDASTWEVVPVAPGVHRVQLDVRTQCVSPGAGPDEAFTLEAWVYMPVGGSCQSNNVATSATKFTVGFHLYPDPFVVAGSYFGADVIYELPHPALRAIEVEVTPASMGLFQAGVALDANVRYCEEVTSPVYSMAVPNDPLFSMQPDKLAVRADAAWDVSTAATTPRTVCVVDTGLSTDSGDFHASRVPTALRMNFVPGLLGTADATGHGTHVAGIIGADVDDGVGIAGVDGHALIAVAKALGPDGLGDHNWVAMAVAWCADNADVVELAAGLPATVAEDTLTSLHDAVAYAHAQGSLVVAAAGNAGCGGGDCVAYPARWSDHVLAVGCTDLAGGACTWPGGGASSTGPAVALAAPGHSVVSACPPGATACTPGTGAHWGTMSGTSVSSAQVAGAAALVWSFNPTLPVDDLASYLMCSAAPVAPGTPGSTAAGAGLLDVWAALDAVLAESCAPPPCSGLGTFTVGFHTYPSGMTVGSLYGGATVTYALPHAALRAVEVEVTAVNYPLFHATVSNDANVRYCEELTATVETTLTPNDDLYAFQWDKAWIGAEDAWDITFGTTQKTVCVVDTGLTTTSGDFTPSTRVPTSLRVSFVPGVASTADDHGHGTAMAGIAAATTNDAVGVAGVAGGVQLAVAKAFDSTGSADPNWVAAAIAWCADNAHIINLSGGIVASADPTGFIALEDAVLYAAAQGRLVVAAAGNDECAGADCVRFPARWSDHVVAVACSDGWDVRCSWSASEGSSTGPAIALAAPGVEIAAPCPSTLAACSFPVGFTNQWAHVSGTSVSAAQVAGAAALVWSYSPSLTAAQVRMYIECAAVPIAGGSPAAPDHEVGAGLLDVGGALDRSLAGTCAAPPCSGLGDFVVGTYAFPAGVTPGSAYHGADVTATMPHAAVKAVEVAVTAGDYAAFLAGISSDPNVDYCAEAPTTPPEVHLVPTDTLWAHQWDKPDIDADLAWDTAPGGSPAVTLCVVDSGLETTSGDFTPASRVPMALRQSFLSSTAATTDGLGHGTHVAGIAAATMNDNNGIAGVAGNVRIAVARVFNDSGGGGSLAAVVNAIAWCVDTADADVINLSLGWPSSTPPGALTPLFNAVQYAHSTMGRLVVASAGNSGPCGGPGCVGYPARYDTEVMAIACTTPAHVRCNFSSQGAQVDLAAPGLNIASTCRSTSMLCGSAVAGTTEWAFMSGTSMSAPQVSGAAALIWSQVPSLTADQLWNYLECTAQPVAGGSPTSPNGDVGHGLLDVRKALHGAMYGNCTGVAPPPPTPCGAGLNLNGTPWYSGRHTYGGSTFQVLPNTGYTVTGVNLVASGGYPVTWYNTGPNTWAYGMGDYTTRTLTLTITLGNPGPVCTVTYSWQHTN